MNLLKNIAVTIAALILILCMIWWGKHAISSFNKKEPLPESHKVIQPPTELHCTVVYPETGWYQWDQISLANRFASNGPRGFGYNTISSDLSFTYTPLLDGFPGEGTSFRATADGSILWGKIGYRGFLAIDSRSLNTINIRSVTNDGSSEIHFGWRVGKEEPILLVEASFPRSNQAKTGKTWLCYNVGTGELLYKRKDFGNACDSNAQDYLFLIPTQNENEFLGQHTVRHPTTGSAIRDWHVVSIDKNGFSKPVRNNLTKAMSNKNFGLTLWFKEIKRWDINQKYIFGKYTLPRDVSPPRTQKTRVIPAVVRWDETMEDVTISSLLNHVPEGYRIIGAWAVSPNGKWARCGVKSTDFSNETYYNCFYHLDEKYPLGVSKPVMGIESRALRGIFVEHDTLGTLYLDRSNMYKSGVIVYQMNDMETSLKAIAAEQNKKIIN